MKKLEVEWIVKGGSVFTKDAEKIKTSFGAWVTVQKTIAFNVGRATAEHLVRLP